MNTSETDYSASLFLQRGQKTHKTWVYDSDKRSKTDNL